MRASERYMWRGALVGLLAPAGLFLFGIVTDRDLDPVSLSLVLAAGGMIGFALIGRVLGSRSEALEELSEKDALTGLANRRSFDRRLDLELARTKRYGVNTALVMIDLDAFKVLNDRFGHPAGDEVLRRVGAALGCENRAGDLVARYGGEEFVAILSDTTTEDAINWAERARQRLAAGWTAWGPARLAVTASFGVAGTASWSVTKARLIETADRALYEGKRRGGNSVVAGAFPAEAPATRTLAAAGMGLTLT